MHHLIYVSQAVRGMSSQEQAVIVENARTSNAAADVTGMLAGRKGWFLQVIEGPAEALAALFHRISSGPRHGNIRVLVSQAAPARAFPEWRMAVSEPHGLPKPVQKHVFSLQKLSPVNSPGRGSGTAVRPAVRGFLAAFERLEKTA
ncbi:BLUF domain-containing protein [Leisingera sp. D0M16]|uniref:BLUF domain-containing protein n=1 Tax=Leisingera coralii TaxID=3351347 RepID=UPI003B798720